MTPAHSREVIERHGLSLEEYAGIVARLGRDPSPAELGVYSAMWSEHCSYKHSKEVLRLLPATGPRVLVGPGENAGIIDAGDGVVVVFKMESHNHPSAVEPFHGAATGVGGILRDIFTMGARPVALLDNLRFGVPDTPRMESLIEGVVAGIAAYGNCVGVPNVAGDVMFDDEHAGNILVNVMCVGVGRREDILLARASGPGNQVLYFGNATGRDGIHGATFASEELSQEALERRGAVQVADPFMGKKILEATLELIERRLVVGMQDMGAAGLTCSTCEMAARAGTGIDIDLDLVPQRATGMTAYEILLSESQERMLAVVEPSRLEAALEVCRRWECDAHAIGHVTATGRMVVRHRGEVVVDLPPDHLADGAPAYSPPWVEPAVTETIDPVPSMDSAALRTTGLRLLGTPAIRSKRWLYERYDHTVRAATVIAPGQAGAAVVRIRGTPDKLLAVASGGNHRAVALDPRTGGELAVCETALALACVGAEPVGLTNCLNFGSPKKPAVFGAFRRTVEGMAAACEALGIPVTGGNVSFYNEHDGLGIPPTPMVGMVGLVGRASDVTVSGFQHEGDALVVLGPEPQGLGGSAFQRLHGGCWGLGEVDPGLAARLQALVLALIRAGRVRNARVVTRGGLFVALARSVLQSPRGLGAVVSPVPGGCDARGLFGEFPLRVLLGTPPAELGDVGAAAAGARVPLAVVGLVRGTGLDIHGVGAIPRGELEKAYEQPPHAG